jgi:hypothetical protein
VTLEPPTSALSLGRRANAKWFAHQQPAVSCPEDANAFCLQIADRSLWVRRRILCIAGVMSCFDPEGVLLNNRRQRTLGIQITDTAGRWANGRLRTSCGEGIASASSGGLCSRASDDEEVVTWLK